MDSDAMDVGVEEATMELRSTPEDVQRGKAAMFEAVGKMIDVRALSSTKA